MSDYAILAGGVVCAALGAELFVRGAVGLALWLRIAPGIVGATVAAFATSAPELSVAVNAALAGVPQIAFGNVLGANIVNVALVLAVASLILPLSCPAGSTRRDFPAALLLPLLTGVLAFDGVVSRSDGVLLLAAFLLWMTLTVRAAARQRAESQPAAAKHGGWRTAASIAGGLVALFAAGDLIVVGAKGIAHAFGIGEFIIGAVVVAVATTVPELATTIVSKLRGYEEVGLGTVLGSNVFNGSFIVAVAAILHPIAVDWREASVALGFGIAALVFAYPARTGVIGRGRGAALLLLYASFVVAQLRS